MAPSGGELWVVYQRLSADTLKLLPSATKPSIGAVEMFEKMQGLCFIIVDSRFIAVKYNNIEHNMTGGKVKFTL